VSEKTDSYLLPCSCGRSVAIRPRQAGETVRCACGQELTAPSMGEIRRLPTAGVSASQPKIVVKSKWGGAQRLVAAGVVVLALAGILTVVLAYDQHTFNKMVDEAIRQQRESVRLKGTWESLIHFRSQLAPGIDLPIAAQFTEQRQRLAVDMVIAIVLGTIGIILVGIGIAALTRKRSGPS
jgi:hypothetical protein